MRGKVERSVFNRTVTPLASIENRVIIPQDRFSYLVEQFGYSPLTTQVGTRPNRYFKKFMGSIVNRSYAESVTLEEIESYELTETEEAAMQILMDGHSRVPMTMSTIYGALKRN